MITNDIPTDPARNQTGRVPSRRWSRLTVAVIAGLGGGLLTGVGPAAAAVPGLVSVDATLNPSSSQSQSVTVACPAGTKLINAGGYITDGAGSVAMDDIFPNSTNDSVTVTGKETDPYGAAWRPTAVATCAPALPGLTWIHEASPPSAVDKSVTATCPDGTTLVGTGATIEDGFGEVLITTIAPQNGGVGVAADAVTVEAKEEAAYAATWIVNAFAACAAPLAGPEVIRVATSFDSSDPKSKLAECSDGKVATGGGVGTVTDPAGLGNVVVDDVSPNRGAGVGPTMTTTHAWVEDPFIGSWMLFSYAMCFDI